MPNLPSLEPDAPPPPAPALAPEPVVEVVALDADSAVGCTHRVMTYDGPSDVLVLRVKQGETFLVPDALLAVIDQLTAHGHIFTLAE
ncbi:MAG: hypothetical protein H0X24_05180 [Ktedonobacterales bacterium]|nr:hypothetical protein [Ktedonobacterales bacterium]